jgi:hypothetical protein
MKYKILNMLLLLSLFSSFIEIYAQQRRVTVKDSITNEMLPYASINFLNGFGLFTDNNGEAVFEKDAPNKIKVTYVGYAPKTVFIDKLASPVILLQPELNALHEVKIATSKKNIKKRKDFSVKPYLHDDTDRMYWSSIGQQYAFYIPNTKKESISKSVTIPLILKDMHQGLAESSFASSPYGTMVKIEFMSCSDQLPDRKLYDYEKKVVIHSAKIKEKIAIQFEEDIAIPEEGLYIVMTIIGKTDNDGVYIPEMPYAVRELPDRKKKSIKIILPNYALVEAPKGQLTLFRNVFSDIAKWERITRPMVYKKEKGFPFYNIGIGYTFSGY